MDQTRLKPFLKVKSSIGIGGDGQRPPRLKPRFHEDLSVPAHMHECKVELLVQSVFVLDTEGNLIGVQRGTDGNCTSYISKHEFRNDTYERLG